MAYISFHINTAYFLYIFLTKKINKISLIKNDNKTNGWQSEQNKQTEIWTLVKIA